MEIVQKMTKNITSAIIVGATGLVGRALVNLLIAEPSCEKMTLVVRRPQSEFDEIEKITQVVLEDFLMLHDQHISGHSHAFSCLGTTLKQAGSKEAFYETDYTINLHFAKCVQHTDAHYLLVSAMGANPKSVFFYNRVKGKLENDLKLLDLKQMSLLRPSLLLGDRSGQRLLEETTQKVYLKFSHFVPDSFKYKPVTAEQVAHTMVEAAANQVVKFQIYDNLAIQKIK